MVRGIIISILILLQASDYGLANNDIFETIERGDIEKVRFILDKEPELLNKRNADGMTPLNDAAYLGQTEIVRELLERNADWAIRIPIKSPIVRSLNLSTAAGIVLYEAIRKTGQL